jgi:hypothetical protein
LAICPGHLFEGTRAPATISSDAARTAPAPAFLPTGPDPQSGPPASSILAATDTAEEAHMPIDQTKLGAVAAELMDELGSHYGDDAELKNVVIIATVGHAGGTLDTTHWGITPGMPNYVGIGLLELV